MRNYAREFFWGTPPDDPAEKKLLLKLDSVILSYVCLSYFSNFFGNDLTYANQCFTAGYVVGQIPSALVLASGRIPPRIWFPGCCAAWGILTLGLAYVTNPQQVMGIRFTQALFEASTFSGTHARTSATDFILGSWYKDKELGKRSAVFATCAQIGSLFSGVMQGAIISTLEGRNGLRGWQWLFIIDFLITMPIAIYGFIFFPDTPATTKAFWLTEEEKLLSQERVPLNEDHRMSGREFWVACKRVGTQWRFYLFSALFGISATSFEKTGVYSEFLLWLRSTGYYSAANVNYYNSIFTAVAVLSTYLLTLFSDVVNNRFIINPIMFVAVFISSVMLLCWDRLTTPAFWFAYIIAGLGYAGQASNFAWANSMCRDDEVLRSFTVFGMNLISNLWNLWYQIVAWPIVDAPRFRNGQIATLVTGAASVAIAAAIVYCGRRYPTKLSRQQAELEEREMERGNGSGESGGMQGEVGKDKAHTRGGVMPVDESKRVM